MNKVESNKKNMILEKLGNWAEQVVLKYIID